MNLESYCLFLIGSILVSLGVTVLSVSFLFLNHIYSRFWKPVKILNLYSFEDASKIKIETQTVANNESSNTI